MTTSTKRIRLDPDPKAEVQEESDQDIKKLIAENNQLKSVQQQYLSGAIFCNYCL